jgi:hypothetical protein
MIIEHNVETGEITQRELTPEEIEQIEIDAAIVAEEQAAKAAKAASRQAVLDKLGLTAEEAAALFA